MACGVPVLACNSGGPLESVVPVSSDSTQQRTGWLCPPSPSTWSQAILEIISLTPSEREAISNAAKARAEALFSMDAMARGLEKSLKDAVEMGGVEGELAGRLAIWMKVLVMLVGFVLAYAYSGHRGL